MSRQKRDCPKVTNCCLSLSKTQQYHGAGIKFLFSSQNLFSEKVQKSSLKSECSLKNLTFGKMSKCPDKKETAQKSLTVA